MRDKAVQLIDTAETVVLRIIFILVLLLGIYALYDSWYVYRHVSDRNLLNFKPVIENGQVTGERRISDDMVAWLTIEDTDIDYPVMQGKDNFIYVNTDPYGEYSLTGSIFLDYRNSADFTDAYSLIYGHHMEQGAMFGALDRFRDEAYFDSHREGELIVGKKILHIELFAYMEPKASDAEVFEPTEDYDVQSFVRDNALIYKEPGEGRLIALSTCSDAATTARVAVFGILSEE